MKIFDKCYSSMKTTHHLLLDETQKNVHMEAIYRYQTQLNYVDKGLFPLLSYHHILEQVSTILIFAPVHNLFDMLSIRI
jgi:hypothetical protein